MQNGGIEGYRQKPGIRKLSTTERHPTGRSHGTETTMNQRNTTLKSLLLALGGALLATACTISLDPLGDEGGTEGDSGDAQCLELFETCVELAGESPGCDAVFEYCAGAGGEEGGMEPEPGCEENYINCLAEGVDPESCQPLLDACEPGGGDDGGGEDGGECSEDNPDDCEPGPCAEGECEGQCEQLAETCVMYTGDEESCYGELLNACYADDCDAMLNACYEFGGDENICQDITGCYGDEPEPPGSDDCEELLGECYADPAADEGYCQELYPECFEPGVPPGMGQCDWYYMECQGQFAGEFCEQGGQGCEAGVLPEVFECNAVFPDYCGMSGLSESACSQAEEHCLNGFFETELCGSLGEDPTNWLQDLAECNNWE